MIAHHEEKHCPRCGSPFECRVGSIRQCQCYGLTFSENEKEYIRQKYADCLCKACLLRIRHELHTVDRPGKITCGVSTGPEEMNTIKNPG